MGKTVSPEEATAFPLRSPARQRGRRMLHTILPLAAPLGGALLGLLVGALLIALAGADPLAAYGTLLQGAFGGRRALIETLLKTAPLLLMGLGLTVAFRARVWNIGGEGQYLMGALAGALVALTFQSSWPAALLIPAMLAAGLAGGALWAGVAALLKLRLGVNEIISTLMLNYIAEYWLLYLAREIGRAHV